MPWDAESFRRKHNKSLDDRSAQLAAYVANQVLSKTGDEGRAIREANAVVRRESGKRRGRGK